ncbi:MAG TPA: ABC transporter permease subunit [bacterium]|nr:ABC transporter permease subunit [bacterium]
MLAIIKRTIQTNRGALIAYLGINALLMWMYVGMFPSIAKEADQLNKLMESSFGSMMQAFGFDPGSMMKTVEGFLATEQYSIVWPIIMFIMVLSLGGQAIAGEIDQGTMEILLAQPLSRKRLYVGKYIAGLILIVFFSFISVLSVVPFALLHGVDFQITHHLTLALLGMLFAVAIYSLTIMLGSFFSRGKAAAIMAGMLLFMYALRIISNLKESVRDLKYFSFFHYFDSGAALIHKTIQWESVLVFLGVAVLGFLIGLWQFRRRDVAV